MPTSPAAGQTLSHMARCGCMSGIASSLGRLATDAPEQPPGPEILWACHLSALKMGKFLMLF